MPYKDKEKQKTYQREWVAWKRAVWIDQNGPCVVCNSEEKLEVDHIDPRQKSMSVSTMWTRRKEVIEAELSKCQVLCVDCHKEKTKQQHEEKTLKTHNPATMYGKGCRCDSCRGWKQEHNQTSRRYDSVKRKWVGVMAFEESQGIKV